MRHIGVLFIFLPLLACPAHAGDGDWRALEIASLQGLNGFEVMVLAEDLPALSNSLEKQVAQYLESHTINTYEWDSDVPADAILMVHVTLEHIPETGLAVCVVSMRVKQVGVLLRDKQMPVQAVTWDSQHVERVEHPSTDSLRALVLTEVEQLVADYRRANMSVSAAE